MPPFVFRPCVAPLLQSHTRAPPADACVSTSAKDKGNEYSFFAKIRGTGAQGTGKREKQDEGERDRERVWQKGERTQFGANTAGRTHIHGRVVTYTHTHIRARMHGHKYIHIKTHIHGADRQGTRASARKRDAHIYTCTWRERRGATAEGYDVRGTSGQSGSKCLKRRWLVGPTIFVRVHTRTCQYVCACVCVTVCVWNTRNIHPSNPCVSHPFS